MHWSLNGQRDGAATVVRLERDVEAVAKAAEAAQVAEAERARAAAAETARAKEARAKEEAAAKAAEAAQVAEAERARAAAAETARPHAIVAPSVHASSETGLTCSAGDAVEASPLIAERA